MRHPSRIGARRLVPGPGTVLATIALMVALGGTAAANLPGNNTVVSGDIVNGAVRAPDIATNAVRAPEIRANAVGQSEIANDAVGAGELKATFINGSGNVVSAGTSGQATATCPAGMQVVSGGFNWDQSVAGLATTSMELNTAAQSVTVVGFNATAFNRTLSARAYCIS
jgi:hypothetical protein